LTTHLSGDALGEDDVKVKVKKVIIDLPEARREAIDRIEAAAQDEDIVGKAQNNAEDSIRQFLISLGYKEVVFT